MQTLNNRHIFLRYTEAGAITENNAVLNKLFSNDTLLGKTVNSVFPDFPTNIPDENFILNIPYHSKNFFECKIEKLGDSMLLTGFDLVKVNLLKIQLSNIEMISDRNISKLHKVNDLLEEANLVKEKFLSKVSHELRTPLNAIMGFSEILQKNNYNDAEYYVNLIDSNSKLLYTYVEDLLIFSNNNSSKFHLSHIQFSPSKLLFEIDEIVKLSPELNNKNIEFVVENNFSTPHIFGDEIRIRQVIINLVNNSLKFTSKGFVKLSLSENIDNNTFAIIVEDTGIGMSEQNLEKIFNEFVQLESDNQDKGLGLGLSIVKTIVNKMEGEIAIESKLNVGTKFTITLPKHTSKNIDTTIEEKDIKIEKKLKFLYVEDSVVNQKVFQAHLKNEEHILNFSLNMDDGYSKVLENEYDIIFIDINLNNQDGKLLIQKIREKNKTTPIVALTAHSLDTEKVNCYNAGADYFLTKPYSALDLNMGIYSCISIKKAIVESDFSKQFSDDSVVRKKLITNSINELINNIGDFQLEIGSKINISVLNKWIQKSKTATYVIEDTSITQLMEEIEEESTLEDKLDNTKVLIALIKIKNQCTRLLASHENEYNSQ